MSKSTVDAPDRVDGFVSQDSGAHFPSSSSSLGRLSRLGAELLSAETVVFALETEDHLFTVGNADFSTRKIPSRLLDEVRSASGDVYRKFHHEFQDVPYVSDETRDSAVILLEADEHGDTTGVALICTQHTLESEELQELKHLAGLAEAELKKFESQVAEYGTSPVDTVPDFVESFPAPLVIADLSDGDLLWNNVSFEETFSFSVDAQSDALPDSVVREFDSERDQKKIIETELESPSGESYPVEVSGSSLVDLDQQRALLIFYDVSPRDYYRRKSERMEKLLREFHRISSDKSVSLYGKVRELIEFGRDYLGLESGFVNRIAEGVQTTIAACGENPDLKPGLTASLENTYCRFTIEQPEIMTVSDAPAEGWDDDPAYEKFGLRSYIGTKLDLEDGLYGTLCFASRDVREHGFSDTDKVFVDILGRWLSFELERRQLIQERKKEVQQLTDLLDTLPAYVMAIDQEGRIQQLNQEMSGIFGKDPGKCEGEFYRRLIEKCEDQWRKALKALEDAHDSEIQGTFRTTSDGGGYRQLRYWGMPFENTDGQKRILWFATPK